ncbi:MAG: CRTAC1 family protein [Planctomycetota bacterium]|nr:CRTAC1 family protein [Planctomycetota bacterium]
MALLRPRPAEETIVLHDVLRETGIAFRHTDGGCGQRIIMETVCAGLATFDYDGDGLIDIYFLNGAPLKDCPADPAPRKTLYRNLGGWKFVEVTAPAGVGDLGYGLGVTVGDYDNDGFPDIFLNNCGPNALYHNNGDGTFTEVATQAGVQGGEHCGAGACFLDADGDGDLDLFAANYLEFSYEKHATVTIRGVPAYASPQRYPPARNRFYRNNGDGTFTDISDESGIGQQASWGMGAVCADYDNDGDTDIFVANDVAENFLFENDGQGHFQEVAVTAGTAYDCFGSPQGSMGVECGDFDNDGRLDFYQTSFQLQHAVLYRNLGQGQFEDCSFATGASAGTYSQVTWGCGLVDFDNDGHRDLYVACGHLHDRVEEFDRTTSYLARNILLRNDGTGRFVDITDRAGDGMQLKLSSRGAAFDDLDNDGDVDAVILNSRREPSILRNDTRPTNHWLQIELVGVHANRDGVGAQVRVTAGDLVLADEVHSGRGYQSHFGSRLQFGLGPHRRVERIEVRWIGGGVDVVLDVASDRRIKIVEGQAQAIEIRD